MDKQLRTLRMPNVLSALVRTLICQVIAIALFIAVPDISNSSANGPSPTSSSLLLVMLIGAGLAGALSAKLLNLSKPWIAVNGMLPGTMVLSLFSSLPLWFFFAVVFLPIMLYLPALFAQVPYFPSSSATVEKLLEILPEDRAFTLIDLGCGFGEPLLSLARARPRGLFYGIDLSPLSIAVAWCRSLFQPNVTFRPKNLWAHPLGDYDFVYAFLAPPPMRRLGEKIAQELKPEGRFISNSFPVPEWKGDSLPTGDLRQHTLFIYGTRKNI